jgi:hypothetical protein
LEDRDLEYPKDPPLLQTRLSMTSRTAITRHRTAKPAPIDPVGIEIPTTTSEPPNCARICGDPIPQVAKPANLFKTVPRNEE